MARSLAPLVLGVGALFLLSRKARAAPPVGSAGGPGSGSNSNAKPDPDLGTGSVVLLPPGEYSAKDGERVVLDMSQPDIGPIMGMQGTRDGVPLENIYSGLLSGFELEYRQHGVEVEFFQQGDFELSAIPLILDEDRGVDWDASLGNLRVWRFLVQGVAGA